jgi:hypothetical protein
MSVTRSALLDDLRALRRDVNARLDILERKLLERSVAPPPPSRSAPPASRGSSPVRRPSPRRPPVARWRDQRPGQRSSPRTPTATKVSCDACRDVCWENCACSCHQVPRVAAR